ncbi:hypothetical protein E2562_017742 [Oryza meyeriana var. granulata]|uniref:Uncharacterized protein n=1 Tax=Oryza meyeriana var. granulata TaxID=110450 RepID=A0A6G1BXP6_9ORYZ|nr:hypothetical protein E2562_017742 [Oryza meyeriana var. granulata]
MGTSPAVEELTRLYQELPRRPSAEEVEAAAPPEDGVPGEILEVLREARENSVPPIGWLRRRKEAAIVMEVERRFKVFDDLLERASRVVAP